MTSDVWGIFNLPTYLVHSTLIRYFTIYLQKPFLQMRFSLTYPITYLNIWCHIRIYECSLIYINRKLLITTTINFLGLGHLLCYHHNITYNSMGWKFLRLFVLCEMEKIMRCKNLSLSWVRAPDKEIFFFWNLILNGLFHKF